MSAPQTPWTCDEFEAQLRAKGQSYYIHHPFNVKLNSGQCSKDQVRGWVMNRFYYQWIIPLKDAAILSNCQDRETRRRWIARILDHDGYGQYQTDSECGGLEAWTRLGLAVGIDREELWSLQHVSPAVKFACDAYVNFARQQPWQEAVCSSLTEMFAPPNSQRPASHLADTLPLDRIQRLALFSVTHTAGAKRCLPRVGGHA